MTAFRKFTVIMLVGAVTLGCALIADYSLLLQVDASSDVAMGQAMPYFYYNN